MSEIVRNLVFEFVFVLMGWSLLPNALQPFKIYCAPPNLDIRTWICRFNFAQRPVFSGLRFFNEPEISDLGTSDFSPSWMTCAQDFYVLKKSIDLSRVWTREPWISKHVTPRPPRPTTSQVSFHKTSAKTRLPPSTQIFIP